jgi:hypothetical protein
MLSKDTTIIGGMVRDKRMLDGETRDMISSNYKGWTIFVFKQPQGNFEAKGMPPSGKEREVNQYGQTEKDAVRMLKKYIDQLGTYEFGPYKPHRGSGNFIDKKTADYKDMTIKEVQQLAREGRIQYSEDPKVGYHLHIKGPNGKEGIVFIVSEKATAKDKALKALDSLKKKRVKDVALAQGDYEDYKGFHITKNVMGKYFAEGPKGQTITEISLSTVKNKIDALGTKDSKTKDAYQYRVKVGNLSGWDFTSFSDAMSYAKNMAVQNKAVTKIYPLHEADNKITIIDEKGNVIGKETIPNPKENYRQWRDKKTADGEVVPYEGYLIEYVTSAGNWWIRKKGDAKYLTGGIASLEEAKKKIRDVKKGLTGINDKKTVARDKALDAIAKLKRGKK